MAGRVRERNSGGGALRVLPAPANSVSAAAAAAALKNKSKIIEKTTQIIRVEYTSVIPNMRA